MNEPKPWLAQSGGIAERLGALLDASDITAKELATRLGVHPSKVTRGRNGSAKPTRDEVIRWAAETGGEADTAALLEVFDAIPADKAEFEQRMAAGQAHVQNVHSDLAQESRLIRYFDTCWIPGLLQTRDYARRVFEEMVELHNSIDDLDDAIAASMRRQHLLYARTKQFEVLVDESALVRTTVATEIMVPQLNYLLTWLSAPNVRLGVLPLRGANRRTPQGGFQIYDDVAIVEDFAGERERPSEIFARVFKDMWTTAAVGPDARPLIEQAIEMWQRPT